MKLAFICGCMEEGRDGVGDYTRRLAGELIKLKHEVMVIAMSDKYLDDTVYTGQYAGGNTVNILRLPERLPLRLRIAEAKQYIDKFDPEWLSLQYVIFSYHPKGLPFGLNKHFKQLGQGRKWHIMFHELWVAMNADASFKWKLWGLAQKSIITRMIKAVKPKVIHTNTQLYLTKLKKEKVQASVLPLFGNIPVSTPKTPIKKILADLNFIVFGGIHHGAPVEDFISEIIIYSKKNKLKPTITFIGRNGAPLQHWVAVCKRENIEFVVLGERPAEDISAQLQKASWGIVTTPYMLVEKSGAAAAMIEHGLPVLCVCRDWPVEAGSNINMPGTVQLYYKGFFDDLKGRRVPGVYNAGVAAVNFIDSLNGKY